MKYIVNYTSRFKKDYKQIKKQGYDIKKLFNVVLLLAEGKQLEDKYRDHFLTGEYGGCRECHITPDWLLIYKISNNKLELLLTRTGSHSNLFK